MLHESQRKKVTILGRGYVGQALFNDLVEAHDVVLTSRQGKSQGEGTLSDPLKFDLEQEETWDRILSADFIVWTFPAATTEGGVTRALEFYGLLHSKNIPTLVMASTSSYLTPEPDSLVDESCPLDLSQIRVKAEDHLMNEGCFLLVLSGIFGPGRDPAQWLKRGLVKNENQYINLIHIKDIAKIVLAWLHNPLTGLRLNASDGRHRRWHELAADMKKYGLIEAELNPFSQCNSSKSSKRVCNGALVKLLYAGPFHSYPEEGL